MAERLSARFGPGSRYWAPTYVFVVAAMAMSFAPVTAYSQDPLSDAFRSARGQREIRSAPSLSQAMRESRALKEQARQVLHAAKEAIRVNRVADGLKS